MDTAGFDSGAAQARRARGDMRPFLQALAARLEGALPGMVEVARKRDGLFSGETHAAGVTVSLDHWTYAIELRHGGVTCRRAKMVHGVRLSAEEMAMPTWLAALDAELRALGDQQAAAHDALHDFLIG